MAKKAKKVIQNNNSLTIAYSGKVTAALKKKDSTVNKKVLFNTGTQNLFKFIALALSGYYNEARAFRPQFLNLFSVEDVSNLDVETDLLPSKKINLSTIMQETAAVYNPIADPNDPDKAIGYSVLFGFITYILVHHQIFLFQRFHHILNPEFAHYNLYMLVYYNDDKYIYNHYHLVRNIHRSQ